MSGPAAPLLPRLWLYQAERFPLGRHGPLILVFSGACVGYGHVLAGAGGGGRPLPLALAIATAVVLLQFFLMRIADEFKDAEADRLWRPERPVPRGLVSLPELAWLGLVAAALQALLVLAAAIAALPWLAAVWGWFLLMGAEFFRPLWLRRRLALYALSHLLIVPLLALLAMALQGSGPLPLAALLPFLFCTYACALCLELARKTWLPQAERPGLDSYSARWGLAGALRLWHLSLLLSAAAAAAAALRIQEGALLLPPLAVALALVLALARRPGGAEPLATPTSLWILAVYLGLGWWPWLAGARW